MKVSTTLLSALVAASSVAAHATFQEFWSGSTDLAGTCVRKPQNNNPVSSVTSADIACNANPSASTALCTVAAGGKASVEMHQQPGDRSCSNEAIGGNHDGPVIVYMAKVDNALTASATSAKWFKVAQLGLISKDVWGTDSLNSNCGKFEFTVPSCIPSGNYLVRAEVIALHVAGQLNGAQPYVSCFTVNVTGGGSTQPPTVSFPGAYSATDPGIKFDIYGSYTSYTIPGPAVFTCGGGTGTPVTTTPGGSSSTTKPVTPVTTSSTPATTPGAALYGQCGGKGWNGPTTCSAGTCKASGEYYSQCLP